MRCEETKSVVLVFFVGLSLLSLGCIRKQSKEAFYLGFRREMAPTKSFKVGTSVSGGAGISVKDATKKSLLILTIASYALLPYLIRVVPGISWPVWLTTGIGLAILVGTGFFAGWVFPSWRDALIVCALVVITGTLLHGSPAFPPGSFDLRELFATVGFKSFLATILGLVTLLVIREAVSRR